MKINNDLIIPYSYEEAKKNVETYDLDDLKVEFANACLKYNQTQCLDWLSYKRLLSNELLRRTIK